MQVINTSLSAWYTLCEMHHITPFSLKKIFMFITPGIIIVQYVNISNTTNKEEKKLFIVYW